MNHIQSLARPRQCRIEEVPVSLGLTVVRTYRIKPFLLQLPGTRVMEQRACVPISSGTVDDPADIP
jgi:hypothetical protein